MSRKKTALFNSILSLLLCVSMLIGTTFAWFTDSVVTGMNTIAAGVLDVELYHTNAVVADEKVDASTKLFLDLQGDPILWEPGVVSYENLRIANEGDLALAYQMMINTANENYIVNPSGEQYGLSQILKVGVVAGGITAADRAGVVASVEAANWTTLADFLYSGSLLPASAGNNEETWGVVIYWEPGENDNLWNLNNGKQLNVGEALQIDLGISLVATQEMQEEDSIDNTYGGNAKAEFFLGFQGGSAGTAVTTDEQGMTTAEAAMNGGDVSAVVPAGVQVADGAASLALVVTVKDSSEANIVLGENEEMSPLDVHMEGVAAGNTVPMQITLKNYLSTGINTGALKLYHVENGTTVAMTQVQNPVNHNEFSYDPLTGDVTLSMASFSEVAVVADTNNPWNGNIDCSWYNASAAELTISNADQLAGFGAIVDGTATGIEQDSFEGKIVKLSNNIYLSKVNFDPIGWGYVNTEWNAGGAEGKVFMGTFDGNNKIIFDLYQHGWDLEAATGTVYTYTNCGFGLFAAASGAIFKNLVISGANISTECVEMGVLVGLSQNSCTYENIKIYNSKIANYQRPAGGLIGEVSGDGTTTISDVVIGSDVVVGSLWGDFDASCGGVIGARWDDVDANPQIVMSNVQVSCKLDVYNDVTSAYQWHAYRRAGMLIGNTDTPAANGKTAQTATADFLTCKLDENGDETVRVHIGNWANYHYCRFTNDNNPGKNYPWVRVEAGENNDAYSNPRYGHPVDKNGKEVVDINHDCDGGDYHNMVISFAQLYGGGQGVYGATAHKGVKVEGYRYSIIYMNNNEVLSIQFVTDDMVKATDPFIPNDPIAKDAAMSWVKTQGYADIEFDCWVSAGSKEVKIPASNTENVIVYPSFTTPYTARFVDLDGNVLDWCFFNKNKSDIVATETNAKKLLPPQDENIVKFSNWEVHYYDGNGNVVTEVYDSTKFTGNNCYQTDVTIYPVYTYNGNLNLEPVDSDGDGKTNYYKVVATKALNAETKIPGNVLGIPVKLVEKLYKNDNNWDYGSSVTTIIIEEGVEELARNSLGYTSDLTMVELPSTLKTMGKNTFSRNLWYNIMGDTDTKKLTIKYNGTKGDWDKLVANSDKEWANGLKKGTTVECTDGTYTVTSVNIETSNHKWSWTAKTIN